MIVNVNFLAVLVSVIASMIIGALWYSPVLFGKAWMKLSKINPQTIKQSQKKGMWKAYLGTFIGLFVMGYVLSHIIAYAQAHTLLGGITAGVWVWIGFIAPVMLGSIFWEQKPITLYVINVAHYLVVLIIMGGILGVWH